MNDLRYFLLHHQYWLFFVVLFVPIWYFTHIATVRFLRKRLPRD